jgi:hypothetical protein
MTHVRATFTLLSLCAACGLQEGSTGGGATDGGGPIDGASSTDVGAPTADGSATDAGSPIDDGSSSDAAYASPPIVNLGKAGTFAILTKAGITNAPTSVITGDLGVSPGPASYITGFPLTPDVSNVFSTSPQIVGKVYASDYASPSPSNLIAAIGDMQSAFNEAAGRTPDVVELGAGDIGGMTLTRGVYGWSSGLLVPTSVTLTGSATDVWIFQIAQGLTVSSATSIFLTGGALPKNVFWDVSGAIELGTGSHFEGIVLAKTAIALRTGASFKGRLLAQTAVTIDSSTIVQSAP